MKNRNVIGQVVFNSPSSGVVRAVVHVTISTTVLISLVVVSVVVGQVVVA